MIGTNLNFSDSSVFFLYNYFYTKLYIYEFLHKFDKVLYQFFETGTSDRTLICINQLLRFSGFSLYLFQFFCKVPLNKKNASLF